VVTAGEIMACSAMNESHPRSCRCAWHVCRSFLRFYTLRDHPLFGATVKIASWGGLRMVGGEPDKSYSVVVEWADLTQALESVQDHFLWAAGRLQLTESNTRLIHDRLRLRFPKQWADASARRFRTHRPNVERQDGDGSVAVAWLVTCSCGWAADPEYSPGDADAELRSHLSPLREALDQCAEVMARKLGEDFGGKVRSQATMSEQPPEFAEAPANYR